MKNSPTSN